MNDLLEIFTTRTRSDSQAEAISNPLKERHKFKEARVFHEIFSPDLHLDV